MLQPSYQDAASERLSDRDFVAWLPVDFHDGTIEVDLASDLGLRIHNRPMISKGGSNASIRQTAFIALN